MINMWVVGTGALGTISFSRRTSFDNFSFFFSMDNFVTLNFKLINFSLFKNFQFFFFLNSRYTFINQIQDYIVSVGLSSYFDRIFVE